jgi:hypothetical protein
VLEIATVVFLLKTIVCDLIIGEGDSVGCALIPIVIEVPSIILLSNPVANAVNVTEAVHSRLLVLTIFNVGTYVEGVVEKYLA